MEILTSNVFIICSLLLICLCVCYAFYCRYRRANEALVQNQMRLMRIVLSSFDAVFLHEDGIILDINPVALQLFGYEAEEMTGRQLLDFVAEESKQLLIERLAANADEPYEVRIISKEQTNIPAEIRVKSIDLEGRLVRVVNIRDTSERKQTEKILRAVNDKLDDRVQQRSSTLDLANTELVREIGERIRAVQVLKRREAILEAVAFSAEQFLNSSSWSENIPAVLERLGTAAQVSYVYIYENDTDSRGQLLGSHRHEWSAPGMPSYIGNAEIKGVPYRDAGFGRWEETLSQGRVLYGRFQDFPAEERAALAFIKGLKSVAAVPVFIGTQWWGFVGYDECVNEMEWSSAEIDALKVLADILGAAIQRERYETALKDSEQRFRAIFEQAAVGVALIETKTERFLKINKKYRDIIGITDEEMNSADYRGSSHPDDMTAERNNMEKLIDGRLHEFSMEKRYIRNNGDIVWVNRTVSPLWELGAEPNYHIAIVEEITERKRAEQNTQNLLQQNRTLTQRLFTLQEEERRYLAQELHDEFGQLLTAMDLHVKSIAEICGSSHVEVMKSVNALDGITAQMYQDIRNMIHRFRPVLLDQLGLAASLTELTSQWQNDHPGIECRLLIETELTALGEDLDITVFRTIQEALTNVAKHAQASRIEIRIHTEVSRCRAAEHLFIRIKDDGKGREPSLPTKGIGLLGMRERVLAVGGEFSAENGPGEGFCINLSLPFKSTQVQ